MGPEVKRWFIEEAIPIVTVSHIRHLKNSTLFVFIDERGHKYTRDIAKGNVLYPAIQAYDHYFSVLTNVYYKTGTGGKKEIILRAADQIIDFLRKRESLVNLQELLDVTRIRMNEEIVRAALQELVKRKEILASDVNQVTWDEAILFPDYPLY
jgi:hypothetical protein